jgi:hypothetical protein
MGNLSAKEFAIYCKTHIIPYMDARVVMEK